MVAVNSEHAELVNGEEFVEVRGEGGGDFPPTWDFNEEPRLVGVYRGSETKEIKGKDRTIHTFDVDGVTYNAWGTAILDDRLNGLDDKRVLVVKTGKKIPTKSGNGAWEFQVYVSKAALG